MDVCQSQNAFKKLKKNRKRNWMELDRTNAFDKRECVTSMRSYLMQRIIFNDRVHKNPFSFDSLFSSFHKTCIRLSTLIFRNNEMTLLPYFLLLFIPFRICTWTVSPRRNCEVHIHLMEFELGFENLFSCTCFYRYLCSIGVKSPEN